MVQKKVVVNLINEDFSYFSVILILQKFQKFSFIWTTFNLNNISIRLLIFLFYEKSSKKPLKTPYNYNSIDLSMFICFKKQES